MNKWLVGTLVGGITFFLLGGLIYELLLGGFYEANVGSATGAWREPPVSAQTRVVLADDAHLVRHGLFELAGRYTGTWATWRAFVVVAPTHVVPVAFVLLGRERVQHGGATARAVDQPTQYGTGLVA